MIYQGATTATFAPVLLDEARVRVADAIRRLQTEPELGEVVIERQIRDVGDADLGPIVRAYEAMLAREGHRLAQRTRRNAKGYEHAYIAVRSSRMVSG